MADAFRAAGEKYSVHQQSLRDLARIRAQLLEAAPNTSDWAGVRDAFLATKSVALDLVAGIANLTGSASRLPVVGESASRRESLQRVVEAIRSGAEPTRAIESAFGEKIGPELMSFQEGTKQVLDNLLMLDKIVEPQRARVELRAVVNENLRQLALLTARYEKVVDNTRRDIDYINEARSTIDQYYLRECVSR